MTRKIEPADMIPDIVREHIEEYTLPDLADGYHTAWQITTMLLDEAADGLEAFFSAIERFK